MHRHLWEIGTGHREPRAGLPGGGGGEQSALGRPSAPARPPPRRPAPRSAPRPAACRPACGGRCARACGAPTSRPGCGRAPWSAVHAAARARLAGARARVAAQADILVLGVPDMSPYAVHSDMNPLLVANAGLGYAFQFGRAEPLVRPGGTVVLANPVHPRVSPASPREPTGASGRRCFPAPGTRPSWRSEYQPRFVRDAGAHRGLPGGKRAYHPVHPFYAWYWTVPGPGPRRTGCPGRLPRARGGRAPGVSGQSHGRGGGGGGAGRLGGTPGDGPADAACLHGGRRSRAGLSDRPDRESWPRLGCAVLV